MFGEELCLDANIFIAALSSSEEHHKICHDVLKKVQEEQVLLYEPGLVLYEVVSALHKKTMKGEMTSEEVEVLIDHLFKLPLLFQWKSNLIKETQQVATKLDSTKVYDSSYLALARVRDIPLITLDEGLRKKGRKIFRKILLPTELFH
ncbi:MAG: type II toxin-antitoxin system VapC family toxin [Deltaproteobacteria bacterium]|nr:type II toxin-antitoxin system VapC family toxin [Deltaproteobacteria bacterium]